MLFNLKSYFYLEIKNKEVNLKTKTIVTVVNNIKTKKKHFENGIICVVLKSCWSLLTFKKLYGVSIILRNTNFFKQKGLMFTRRRLSPIVRRQHFFLIT